MGRDQLITAVNLLHSDQMVRVINLYLNCTERLHPLPCVQEEGATELWLKYESLTFGLSQILFEELRLILLPTKAAQLKYGALGEGGGELGVGGGGGGGGGRRGGGGEEEGGGRRRGEGWRERECSCLDLLEDITRSAFEKKSQVKGLLSNPGHCRGDFRTGKRLNMRRIIPYIASNFQNNRIWLRRSKPSQREYQVLLAVDDSSSMNENQCIQV